MEYKTPLQSQISDQKLHWKDDGLIQYHWDQVARENVLQTYQEDNVSPTDGRGLKHEQER